MGRRSKYLKMLSLLSMLIMIILTLNNYPVPSSTEISSISVLRKYLTMFLEAKLKNKFFRSMKRDTPPSATSSSTTMRRYFPT